MTLSEQQLVCTRPFEWFEIHPDGSVFLCCPAWLKRPIGNLLRQTVEEIWNGPVAQEIRKSIINHSFHNCSRSRCPHLLNRTGPVSQTDAVIEQRIKNSLQARDSRLSYLPRQLNLCFDHSCNLACPSCRPQIQQAAGTELRQAEQLSTIVRQELLPHADSITLSGFGDPFGSPTYLALLRQINNRDFPNLQQVRLHSNGQLLNENVWQSLPDLQPLISEIEISIDAGSESTYQLNRPGGSYSQLLKNLTFLSTTGCQLTLSMVVQQNNWREIPALLKLAAQLGAHLYLSGLVNWGTFSSSDYRSRAVHLRTHPEHNEYSELLTRLPSGKVNIGNLAPFLS